MAQERNARRRDGWLATIVRRYLPAEVVGTAAALAALLATTRAGSRLGAAVVAATWAEAAAFYVFVSLRELRDARARCGWPTAVLATTRGVVSEFGVAEAADVLVLRPVAMLFFARTLGNPVVGAIAGKLAADVVFYALAAPAYVLRVRARR